MLKKNDRGVFVFFEYDSLKVVIHSFVVMFHYFRC